MDTSTILIYALFTLLVVGLVIYSNHLAKKATKKEYE